MQWRWIASDRGQPGARKTIPPCLPDSMQERIWETDLRGVEDRGTEQRAKDATVRAISTRSINPVSSKPADFTKYRYSYA